MLKQRNAVRSNIFNNPILKEQVKKIIGSDLSYFRNYLKKKVFSVERYFDNTDEFTRHLFGNRASFNEVLRKSAASLRFFRDKTYKDWSDVMHQVGKSAYFESHLKTFYDDYAKFRNKMLTENQFTLDDYYQAVLESDIAEYQNVPEDPEFLD
jgi:hypothetical protein